MDRSERFGDLPTALLKALEGWQSGIWTALPCIIVSFDAVAMTCVAQPAIQGNIRQEDGTFVDVNMPLLLDVPVIFPSGGGFTLTFPIAAGDEALVVLASRCIDSWWQLGGIRPQAELRMHDLSDSFALVGPRSQPRVLANVSITSSQLRSDDGVTIIDVDNAKVTITSPSVEVIATDVRVQATNATVHASGSYKWDVNGYGQKVTYAGGDVWNVDTYFIPVLPQVVNTTPNNISAPEIP